MQADFLVATFHNSALSSGFLNMLGEERLDYFKYGCRGYIDTRGMFWGRYENGRVVVHIPGSLAHHGLTLLSLSDTEVSVARLDLQSTLSVTDADWLISQLRAGKRYRAYWYTPANETTRGSTLYVGAPKSRKRLRVYNKSAQAGLDTAAGELLRVELQLRDANADVALAIARRSHDALYTFFRETVTAMASGLDGLLPRANTAHIELPEQEKKPDYSFWLEQSVLPGVQRAKRTPGYTQVLLRELRDLLSDIE